jgi:acetyl esterase/lipase
MMLVRKIWVAVILFAALVANAQEEVPLYKGVAPGSENWKQKEVKGQMQTAGGLSTLYQNVVRPTLTIYRPQAGKANGTAVVVCPGGAYIALAWDLEGTKMAKWLTARGITAFVLKYRTMPLPDDTSERTKAIRAVFSSLSQEKDFNAAIRHLDAYRKTAIADGQQAIRYVREHAAQWGVKEDRIGIMGFSAGAGLTVGVVRDHDASAKPNFAAPIYGFDVDYQQPLPADAPPVFIVATQADESVPIEQSILLFSEWTKAKVPAELHVFEKGPHGFGISQLNLPVDHWTDAFEQWLKSRGLLSK